MIRRRAVLVVLAAAVVAASCGSTEETTTTTAVAGDTTTTTTTTTEAPTTTATATTTLPETTTSPTLAGEPIDFFTKAGDVLSVVGVGYDDTLNVRAGPGIFNDRVDAIEPTGTAVATGNARDLGQAIWVELDTGDAVGWSNYAFLAYAGATDEATAEAVGLLGEYPTAATMEELGQIVAVAFASTEPPSVIVPVVAATVGDLGEITYDVLGFADDAVYGYRLHVFGEPLTDGFGLRNVERTVLCGRGVDAGGLCV